MNLQSDGLLGWATGLLIEHDIGAPGVLRRALSAGPQRRQAIFAAVAVEHALLRHEQVTGNTDRAADARALLLRDGSPREIVVDAYGTCPEGFLGALERVGLKPLRSARTYRNLHSLFLDPAERHRAAALRHVGSITENTIKIVTALRPPFTTHGVVSRLRYPDEAEAFMRAVDIVQNINTKATDEAILEAVAALRPGTTLAVVMDRLVKRADVLPAGPIPDDEEVKGFSSAADLIATGRRYRNCLRTKLRDVLSGYRAYVELRAEVIMEFVRLSNERWLYVDCHGPGNAPVREDLEEAARRKAMAHGIPYVIERSPWQGFGACGGLVPDLTNPLSEVA